MLNVRKTTHLVLAVCLLASGLFWSGSECRLADDRVDLENVIVQVRDLTGVSGSTSGFERDFRRAVTAIKAAAGLKTVLKSAAVPAVLSNAFFYVAPSCFCFSALHVVCKVETDTTSYASIFLKDPLPPPRFL